MPVEQRIRLQVEGESLHDYIDANDRDACLADSSIHCAGDRGRRRVGQRPKRAPLHGGSLNKDACRTDSEEIGRPTSQTFLACLLDCGLAIIANDNLALLQAMVKRDPLIKDETLSLPKRVGLIYLLQVA